MSTIRKGTASTGIASLGTISKSSLFSVGDVPGITITSGAPSAIAEHSGDGQSIYTVTARDKNGSTSGFAFAITGTDAGSFSINSSSGVVTLTANPNFEAKNRYEFTVEATKSGLPKGSKAVVLNINNIDDTAPTITSGATATAIAENSGAGQVIYTVTADDSSDISGGVTFSKSGTDQSHISIDSATGAVTLTANPDFETKSSYSFNVIATDAEGNSSTQAVTLAITNVVNEHAPVFTSTPITASAVAENASSPGTVAIYDFDDNITNPDGVSLTLSINSVSPNNSGGSWSIDSDNILRHSTAFDYEANNSYQVSVNMSYTLADGTSGSDTMGLVVAISDDTSDNGIQHTITHFGQCVAGSGIPYTEANGFCVYGANWTGTSGGGSYRSGSSVSPDHNSIWGDVGADNANKITDLGFLTANYGGYSSSQPYRHKSQVVVVGNHTNNQTNWSVTMNPGVSQTFNKADADVNTFQSGGKQYYEWYLGATVPGSGTAWHAAKNFTNGNTWTATFTVL
jgi:hypothetical protein